MKKFIIAIVAAAAMAAPAVAQAGAREVEACWPGLFGGFPTVCLHAKTWWNGRTAGTYWQWPECDTHNPILYPCIGSKVNHYWAGDREVTWQTTAMGTPLSIPWTALTYNECWHISIDTYPHGTIGPSYSVWTAWPWLFQGCY